MTSGAFPIPVDSTKCDSVRGRRKSSRHGLIVTTRARTHVPRARGSHGAPVHSSSRRATLAPGSFTCDVGPARMPSRGHVVAAPMCHARRLLGSESSHPAQESSLGVTAGRPRTERPPRHPRVVGVATDDTEGHHDGRGQDGRARDAAQGERRWRRRLPARGRAGARPGGHGGRGQRAHRAWPRASATRSGA